MGKSNLQGGQLIEGDDFCPDEVSCLTKTIVSTQACYITPEARWNRW